MIPGDPHPADTSLRSADLIQALPAAIYTCDPEGYIQSFNGAAKALWGRAPVIGRDRWCGSLKMLLPDGVPLEPGESPMAIALRSGKAVAGMEIVIEREDGTRRHVIPYGELIRDSGGRVSGAVNMLVDITARREAGLQQELASRVPFENPSPVLRVDSAGRVALSNPAADELLAGLHSVSGMEAPGDLADVARTALETGE